MSTKIIELDDCPKCGAYHFPVTESEWEERESMGAFCTQCGHAMYLADWPLKIK